jgi:DNA-binding CsgD family transcriptional regulator
MDLAMADMALAGFDRAGCLAAATACVEASRRYRLATEPVAHLWLAGGHALAGDDAAMDREVAAALDPDPHDLRILADLYGRVLATRAIVADRYEDLPELLDTMMEHVRRAPATTSVYPGRILWALVHAVDDADLAVAQRAELEAVVEQLKMSLFDLAREVVEAVVLGRQGDAVAAAARFEPAHEQLRRAPVSVGWAHSQALVVARAGLRDGWGEPVRWLRAAEAFFVERGYPALVRRARRMLGEAGAPVPRAGRGATEVPASLRELGVTSREVDVLLLVAAGCSNKEIAGELYLSPKTVERHLSSLYARTGAQNRMALREVADVHLAGRVGDRTG